MTFHHYKKEGDALVQKIKEAQLAKVYLYYILTMPYLELSKNDAERRAN